MENKKERLAASLSDKEVRRNIKKKIAASTDEGLGKGTFWRSAIYMREIQFIEIMNILLYYFSLQPNIGEIGAGVKMRDLFMASDLRAFPGGVVCRCWQKKAPEWFPFYKGCPWANGPGPMDGTMGPAEYFHTIHPGFGDDSVKSYFFWPEELAEESERNWPRYKQCIERMTFPKFRRKYNAKKLAAALDFAALVWQQFSEEAKKRTV